MARTKVASIPEVGDKAPEFHLPGAQGGQFKLSMRLVRGPVVVVFYRFWAEEDVEYFKTLAEKENEINVVSGTLAGIGVSGPGEAQEFARRTGIKSYLLYDYTKVATREWGLLEKDKEHGEYARPAVFIVDPDREIIHVWIDERPDPAEIPPMINRITHIPKPPEEDEE